MSTFQQIGEGGLNDLLVKRLTTPGGSLAPGVAPELFPTLTLENDRPEWGYLKGEHRYAASLNVAAGGAATRSSIQLVCPNNVLIVVERMSLVVTSGTATIRMQQNPGGIILGTPTARGVAIDTRLKGPSPQFLGRSRAEFYTDNVLPVSATALIIHSSTVEATLTLPVVLSPLGGLYVCPGTDNVAIERFNIQWRERAPQPGELL